jgi:SAM-dependent methyltransferase
MGIDIYHARFLLSAKRRGVDFRRTAMIGRQMMLVDAPSLRALLHEFGLQPTPRLLHELEMSCASGYGEALLRILGAEEIISIDASPYEGATFLHDMNTPIPEELKRRFDVVIDGGTLEHIFNFPVAIKNCMEMVAIGGYFLSTTPANNFPGHGFYQFSPELFYRVLSPENGFSVERAVISEVDVEGRWYVVPDPEDVKSRVEFLSGRPTYLYIQARRCKQVDIMERFPQQSDYTAIWEGRQAAPKFIPPVYEIRRRSPRERLSGFLHTVPGIKVLMKRARKYRNLGLLAESLSRGPIGTFLKECGRF